MSMAEFTWKEFRFSAWFTRPPVKLFLEGIFRDALRLHELSMLISFRPSCILVNSWAVGRIITFSTLPKTNLDKCSFAAPKSGSGKLIPWGEFNSAETTACLRRSKVRIIDSSQLGWSLNQLGVDAWCQFQTYAWDSSCCLVSLNCPNLRLVVF